MARASSGLVDSEPSGAEGVQQDLKQADITNILARRRHDIVTGSLAADGLQLAEIHDF